MRQLVIASAFDMVAERIQRFFSHRGFRVERADGGVECLGAVKRLLPDVLVLDWNLPWGGGAGVLACLRENEATAMVPVILLADRYPSDFDVHTPVTRCLKVPVDVGLLHDAVDSVLVAPGMTKRPCFNGQRMCN